MQAIRQAAFLGLLAVGGCEMWLGGDSETSGPQPLIFPTQSQLPESAPTVSPAAAVDDRQDSDRGGAIVRNSPLEEQRGPTPTPTPTTISRVVRQVVSEPSTQPSVPAAVNGTAIPAASTGGYQTAGAIVVEVSGTPIYADKVLRAIVPKLAAEAKVRDQTSFAALARVEASQQVSTMIESELLYAAAVRDLTAEDKAFAKQRTMAWREQQVTEAGGSEERAKRRAREEGYDFDEKVKEQSRVYLVQVLFQKKLYPKVQVTAQDLRNYYNDHKATEFTEFDQAQYRVIKIMAANMGGRDQAIDRIKQLREEAVAGNDEKFAQLASQINHDPGLRRTSGKVSASEDGWVRRGSFVSKKVDDAVFAIQPGEVTDVIDDGNSFYIARLENRRTGRELPFDDEKVQAQIRDALSKPQLENRREQLRTQLLRDAAISPAQPRLEPVVEMAMQNYQRWRNAN